MRIAHEDLNRHERVKRSSNRAFGFVIAIAFTVVGLWPLIFGRPLRLWAIILAVAIAAVAFWVPVLLTLPNRLWLAFGALLHRIVSPVMLAAMFFVAVMPTGLVMRLLGKDFLALRRKPDLKTYWVERRPPGPPPESLRNQF